MTMRNRVILAAALLLTVGSAGAQVPVNASKVSVNGNIVLPPGLTGDNGTGPKVQLSDGSFTPGGQAVFDAVGNITNGGVIVSVTQTDTTGSRSFGTIYHNTNTTAMYVSGWGTTTGSSVGGLECDNGPTSGLGNKVWSQAQTATVIGGNAGFECMVPAGYYYEIIAAGAVTTLNKWYESVGFGGAGGGGGGGGGLNQLTGDVAAGPGTGSQVATVIGLNAVPFCSGFTPTNGQAVTYTTGSTPNPCWTAVTPSGSFTAAGDLSGSSSTQTVIGLKGTAFCTGFTPTNGQAVTLTTSGSPNPCWTAATPAGGGINQLTGDGTAGPGTGSQTLTIGKVNGVTYPASPASTNLVPVVTTAGGSPAVTYEQIPNGALANPFSNINGTTCTLGAPCIIASGSNIAALWGFGTSIMYGSGATRPSQTSGFALLAANTNAAAYNIGLPSSSINVDVSTILATYRPSPSLPSAMWFESGDNDPACAAGPNACTIGMTNQYMAADAWVAIPQDYRILASSSSGTGGSWTVDANFYIFQSTTLASPGTALSTVVNGATKTFTIPSSASPVVGLTYGVGNTLTGTFTVNIDGVNVVNNGTGTTVFSSAPTVAFTYAPLFSFYRQEFSVTPGISHTVIITTTSTNEVEIAGVDWIPPASNTANGIVLHQSVLANFPSFASLNPLAIAVVNKLHADGLLVYYVDQVGGTPGVNTTTDISATATTNCPATALIGHPNDCGNLHMFQTLIATEIAAGINIGTLNTIGKGFVNTGVMAAPISIGTCISGSAYYSEINCFNATGAGLLYYVGANPFGVGMGADASAGMPWSGQFVNRTFANGGIGAWNCDASYTGGPGTNLDVQTNFTCVRGTELATGNTYQIGRMTASSYTAAGQSSVNATAANITSLLPANTNFYAASVSSTASRIVSMGFGSTAFMSVVRADGTASAPTTVLSGEQIGGINAFAYDGTVTGGPDASMRYFATQNHTAIAHGTKIDWTTTPNGATTAVSRFTIDQDGGLYSTNATGGDKGIDTINAVALYQNNVQVVDLSSAQTLSNKRITRRVSALSANSATPAINTDNFDVVHITAQTATITGFTMTGTPVDGDTLRISITGTASVPFTLGTSFEASGGTPLSTTTSGTTRLDMGFFWNTETSKWRQVAAQ